MALNTTSRSSHVDFCDEMVVSCPGRPRGKWGNALVDPDVTSGLGALVVPPLVVVGADDARHWYPQLNGTRSAGPAAIC